MDGAYYNLKNPSHTKETVYKFAATLVGSSTLFYNLPEGQRDLFISNFNDRAYLSELLDIGKAESAKNGEGVFFIVADRQIGAIHSEPKIQDNRLFFSILVGSENEINELYSTWHPMVIENN